MADAQIRRRRTTLLDQLSMIKPNNLRNLLKVPDEDDGSGAGSRRNGIVTLASILESEKHGGRTLLDIILEDDEVRGGTSDPSGARGNPPGVEEEPAVRVSLLTLLELTDGEGEDAVASASGTGGGGCAVFAVAEEGGEEDATTVSMAVADERIVCCVCMIRRKGAAFIPCGHTFCRLCSRELLTGRGSCPLCNAVIVDILDIF